VRFLNKLGVRRIHLAIIFWILTSFEVFIGVILIFNYSNYSKQMLLTYLLVDIPFILLMILSGYLAYIANSRDERLEDISNA